jgi:hypothetical protein
MAFSLADALRHFFGGDKKKKSAFKSEKEAYDFCRSVYHKTGGVTPELRRAYEFYMRNVQDGCDHYFGPPTDPSNDPTEQR